MQTATVRLGHGGFLALTVSVTGQVTQREPAQAREVAVPTPPHDGSRLGRPRADRGTAAEAEEAVTALYSAHWQSLVRLAALLTGDASVSEEIVQEAFVALHARWRRLDDPQLAHAYLRRSVVNGARSALRHREVVIRHRAPVDLQIADPEELVVRSTEDARVLTALRRLSRRQQEVLVLRYYADLGEADIADALGVTRGAVKTHAHRGLAALREALRATPDPEEGAR